MIPIRGIINGVSVLVILITIYMILRKFGLTSKDTPISREYEDIVLDQLKGSKGVRDTELLDPKYHIGKSGKYKLSDFDGKAKNIKDAFGSWYTGGDDEPEIYAVFESLNNGIEVSLLADSFSKITGESLRGRLMEQLDDYELSYIYNLIKDYEK